MTTIRTLAAEIAAAEERDTAAVTEGLSVYLGQVNDIDGASYEIDDELPDEVVSTLREAWTIAGEDHADEQQLDELVEAYDRAKKEAAEAHEAADYADRSVEDRRTDRDQGIRAALASGMRVVDICNVTGLSRPRIYQIRDER